MTEQPQPQPPQPSTDAQLRVLRMIWAALLMGEVMFLVVATTVAASPEPQRETTQLLFYLALGMLVVLAPVAYIIRLSTYARGRQGDGTIAAGAYATGNILFWAMFEGVGMFAIVGALLNGGRGPHLLVAAIAIAVHVINFPTGRPLRGDDNRLRPMDRR